MTGACDEKGRGGYRRWPVIGLAVFGLMGAALWWSYSKSISPEFQASREIAQAKEVLRRFQAEIEPESLRAWALPYLEEPKSLMNNVEIAPPFEISHLVGKYPISVVTDTGTGSRFVCLWIQMGGFGPFESILVGSTNATVSPSPQRGIRLEWTRGIYYKLDYL